MNRLATNLSIRTNRLLTIVSARALAAAERLYRPAAFVVGASVILSNPAVAQAVDPGTMLTNVTTFITGPFGQTLGVVGIMGIGVAWMFGRASLGLVAGVIGGLIILFGAGKMASTITGLGG